MLEGPDPAPVEKKYLQKLTEGEKLQKREEAKLVDSVLYTTIGCSELQQRWSQREEPGSL